MRNQEKELIKIMKDFIIRRGFHSNNCHYFDTEYCDCGYKEEIQEIRKLYNLIYKNSSK